MTRNGASGLGVDAGVEDLDEVLALDRGRDGRPPQEPLAQVRVGERRCGSMTLSAHWRFGHEVRTS